MKWTKTRPTAPGWYWWRSGGRTETLRARYAVVGGVEQLCFVWADGACVRTDPATSFVTTDLQYAGPIPEPAD